MNNDSEFINIEIDSGVCTVTMNRLEKKNAINPQFAIELCNAWDVIDNDDGVRVAVLKSADSSIFSAGADLKELIPLLKGEIEPTNDYQKQLLSEDFLLKAWRKDKVRTKPLIGVASGYCLAGGFELLLCCDFRLVEENTSIGFPETGIGLLPIAGGVSRIGHEVSRPKALEILFNSANLDVQELKNLGVVNDIFKTEEMEDKIQKYIDKIITSTPESVEVLMKNIDKVRSLNIEDSFLLEEEMGKELF
jgi:enoyl-CoA hydratase